MAFLSEGHKRQFTWKFGIIIALFFILQMFLPMAFMFGGMFLGGAMSEFEELQSAAQFGQETYYLIQKDKMSFSENAPQKIIQLCRYEDKRLKPVAGLELKELPKAMLADGRGIWLIYSNRFELFDGSRVTMEQPFAHALAENLLAASDGEKIYLVYERHEKPRLFWFNGTEESEPMELPELETANDHGCFCGDQLVFWQGMLWHFAQADQELYLQTIGEGAASEWKKLGPFPYHGLHARYDRDGLFLLGERPSSGDTVKFSEAFASKLGLVRVQDEKLGAAESIPVNGMITDLTVINSERGPARAVGQTMGFGGFKIVSFDLTAKPAPKVAVLSKGLGPFSLFWMMPLVYATPIALIFILAVVASLMMPHYHRMQIVLQDGSSHEYASVIRRAVSQALDALLLLTPMIPLGPAVYYIVEHPDNPVHAYFKGLPDSPAIVFIIMGLAMTAMFGWLIICLLYFAILEGRYGWTVGKLVFKIRVLGEEGRAPGFLRALLRNFLRMVDGFFNFVVGVAFIAFTENWQRLGDLAARTVVVRQK